jgi:hypothetical protein
MNNKSKLLINIAFIGKLLYTVPNSKKLINFNMSALARDFGVKDIRKISEKISPHIKQSYNILVRLIVKIKFQRSCHARMT